MTRLAEASQEDAERLLGNQVPETVALAALARSCGAFAATSFGAGFGGSVWALVDRADVDAVVRDWEARIGADSRPASGCRGSSRTLARRSPRSRSPPVERPC